MATATQTYGLTGTLNGITYGFTGTQSTSLTGVTKVCNDLITVASGTYGTLLTFSSTVANASLVTIKQVMLVNMSSTITARVRIVDDTAKEYIVELLPLSSMFIDSEKLEVTTNAGGFSAFSDFDTIQAAGVSGTAAIAVIACGT